MSTERKHLPPKFRAHIEQIEQIEALLNSPFFEYSGFTAVQRRDLKTKLQSFRKTATDIIAEIKRFDQVFQPLGWIVSESTNLETVRQAFKFVDEQKIDDAELILCSDFEGHNLDSLAIRLSGSQYFSKREGILNEAVALSKEKRYLAAVPLILMIADGAGQDIFGLSIFREGLDLTEINAIAGDSEGLQSLTAIFAKTRRTFNSEEISIPYRNGILHGRDNNYGNRLVTSKAWSYLSCLRDIVRAREERVTAKTDVALSWDDMIKIRQDLFLQERMYDEWTPRKTDISQNWKLSAEDVEETKSIHPESILKLFLKAWCKKNFGKMSNLTVDYIRERSASKRAGEIREMLSEIILVDAEILEIDDIRPGETNIKCKLFLNVLAVDMTEEFVFWMQYVDNENIPVVRGHKSGTWKIMPRYYGYSMDLKNKIITD